MSITFECKKPTDLSAAALLARKADVDIKTAKLLIARGIDTPEKAVKFLNPSVDDLQDPFSIAGMTEVAERIKKAIADKERIVIYGDYDCDGLCATTMLCRFLSSTNEVGYFIPNRIDDGYGITLSTIDAFLEKYEPSLVITVDCGITAISETEYLKSRGIDVIITDHHEPQQEIPDCIVIDPKIEKKGFYDYCGAGLVFKIIHAVAGLDKALEYVDYAAVATIADIVPLTDDNRIITTLGLKKLNSATEAREVIRTAARLFQRKEAYTAWDIAFKVAPRVNAAGRLGDADKAMELFLSDNRRQITSIIMELDAYNQLRQQKCEKLINEVKERLKNVDLSQKKVLVLSDGNWDVGILGIAAARISENFMRPVVLFGQSEDGKLRGSARSIGKINVFECLTSCADLFVSYGGHSAAAGVVILQENLELFDKKINDYVNLTYNSEYFKPVYQYDADILPEECTLAFARELEKFEPTGYGNPQPVFRLAGQPLTRNDFKPIGSTMHVKACLGDMELVFFGGRKYYNTYVAEIDVLFTMSVKSFRDAYYIQGVIKTSAVRKFIEVFDNAADYLKMCQLTRADVEPAQLKILPGTLTDFVGNGIFGTLIIASDRQTYLSVIEEFTSAGKFILPQVRWSKMINPYNSVVLLPDTDFCFDYYNNVIFADMPVCDGFAGYIAPSGSRINIYRLKDAKRCDISKFATEFPSETELRAIYIEINKLLSYNKTADTVDLFDKIKSTGYNYSYIKTVFALGVFVDLGLMGFDAKSGFFMVKGKSAKLDDSRIYRLGTRFNR